MERQSIINKIKNLFTEKEMSREDIIDGYANEAIKWYHNEFPENEFPEITDHVISNMIVAYFTQFNTYDEAEKFSYQYIFITNCIDYNINWDDYCWDENGEYSNKYKESEEYKKWDHYRNVQWRLNKILYHFRFDYKWAELNSYKYTIEEAAEIAATKWCELLFHDDIKDNGALNEEHSFMASMLASSIGNKEKETISDDVKTKTHDLLKGYYIAANNDDVEWCNTNVPSEDKTLWRYLDMQLSTDYSPSTYLYTILLNAGIPENKIDWICPWKTSITIRPQDRAVIYRLNGEWTTM